MDTPTPNGDCLQGIFQNLDSLSPGVDSDFDESLAVPESLSVIDTEKANNKEETDASSESFYPLIIILICVNHI